MYGGMGGMCGGVVGALAIEEARVAPQSVNDTLILIIT